MSLAPLTNIPITKLDATAEVVSQGDGSHDHDEVLVTSTMSLAADLDSAREVTLILPLSGEGTQQPLLRYIDDDVRAATAITFDPVERSEADQRVADDLASLADGATKKELQRLAAGVRTAAKGYSQAILKVKPGERQLRFFFSIAAKKVADREFEFQLLAPLGSFVVPVRGTIGVIGILASNTSLVEARAWQDPNNPGSELPRTDASLGGRTCFGFHWTNDPFVRVRYRY